MMQEALREKEKHLENILQSVGSALVAFSGGVDSSYLLYKAGQILGKDRVLAVTAASALFPAQETARARDFAREHVFTHLVIQSQALANSMVTRNPPERCYYCKSALFSGLVELAHKKKLARVLDGANVDDTGDYRPGLKAARELGVLSPLLEAGLTKEQIRQLSREAGLPTWNQPAAACLASRIPYGEPLTTEKLEMIAAGEEFLASRGYQRVRLRCHGPVARLEVPPQDFARLLTEKDLVVSQLKELGLVYVTLDLEGLRSGSMNQVLEKDDVEPSP